MKAMILILVLPFFLTAQNVWEEVYKFEPIKQPIGIECVNNNKLYIGTSRGEVIYSSDKG
jgi:hypothetical protein